MLDLDRCPDSELDEESGSGSDSENHEILKNQIETLKSKIAIVLDGSITIWEISQIMPFWYLCCLSFTFGTAFIYVIHSKRLRQRDSKTARARL